MARNCDAGAVGVGFVRAEGANNFLESDLFSAVQGDVLVPDGVEGVCAFHTLLGGVRWIDADALAQPSQFVGVGGVPVGA